MLQLTASIVTYKNHPQSLIKTINSFLNTNLKIKLFIVDNSPVDILKDLIHDKRVEYVFNNSNMGYGNAHNIAIRKSLNMSKYHLVLNPDVVIEHGVLRGLFNYMEVHSEVGLIMPKVVYPDSRIQYLAKLLPTPLDLIARRFIPYKKIKENLDEKYELRFTGYNEIMEVPVLSGCFMFMRISALNEVGFFDENFFMYLEDVDLSRRIHKKYKTIFYPYARIIHNYEKGSYKKIKLLLYHIKSAIYYFNKWGWCCDVERKVVNRKTLQKLKQKV